MNLSLTKEEDLALWRQLPKMHLLDDALAERPLERLPHVRTSVVQEPTDDWKFLHETAIVAYHGTLFASWYNCHELELQGMTPIRGRRSTDGGRTWSAVEVLGQDSTGRLLYCPPVYAVEHDQLYLFMNTMTSADHIHSLELYKYNDHTQAFDWLWSRPLPFKLNTNAYGLPNGRLMICGRVGELDGFPTTPAVMLSEPCTVEGKWRVIPLQSSGKLPDGRNFGHAETSAVVMGQDILVFCREDTHAVPLAYVSHDCGETWSGPFAHDIPFSNSKIYSGTLSDGRNYVIGNLQPGRSTLAMLFAAPGTWTFSEGGWLADGYDGTLDLYPQFSYPVAWEDDGKLQVIYTMERHAPVRGRGAALATIDLMP